MTSTLGRNNPEDIEAAKDYLRNGGKRTGFGRKTYLCDRCDTPLPLAMGGNSVGAVTWQLPDGPYILCARCNRDVMKCDLMGEYPQELVEVRWTDEDGGHKVVCCDDCGNDLARKLERASDHNPEIRVSAGLYGVRREARSGDVPDEK